MQLEWQIQLPSAIFLLGIKLARETHWCIKL